MTQQQTTDLDPVTIEVLNNRLHQISREAGATLTRTAASPVTVEAKDLGFNITTPTGENIVFSVWMPRHGTTLSHMVKSTIDQFGFEDIEDGDMFLTNDPYAGALHIMDVAILAPVHYDGELIAWTGCATHHLDVGAMSSGWASRSTDWFQEGVKYPPIKIMENSELRDDVFELFLRNVRLPDYQGLDLKAQIAANTVSRTRIRETLDEYGTDAIWGCYDEMLEYGEQTAREKIEALPDGDYHHVDYLDYDENHRLECTLRIDGDEMEFDFSGTAEQASSFVNCAFPCAEANLHNAVQVMMFPEETVNAGTFAPISVEIPEGTVFNSTPPNPCGGASIFAGWRVMSLTTGVLSKAFAASDEPERASAEWGGGSPNLQVYGVDADNEQFTTFMMDQCMLGGGARYGLDGANTTNVIGSTNTSIPNVELIERRYPIRYHHRSFHTESGGAGRQRGGIGGEFAFTPTEGESVTINPFQHRRDSPPFGLFGGEPGDCGGIELYDVDPDADSTLAAELDTPSHVFDRQNEEVDIDASQVILARCAGGGGFDDPLARDPDSVARDVRQGLLNAPTAAEEYGVLIQDGTVDPDATEQKRQEIRDERRSQTTDGQAIDEPCPDCGGSITAVRTDATDTKSQDEEIQLRRHLCADCGSQIEVRVVREGEQW